MRVKSIIATMVALLMMVGMALAVSPHFVSTNTSLDKVGNLVVSFKEAGLGNTVKVDYELAADAVATWQCVTKSGKCPQAANKVSLTGTVIARGTFTADKNGNIVGTLVVSPPQPGDELLCGNGQIEKLSDVQYTNIVLLDLTNNVQASGLPASVGHTFFVCP